MATIAQPTSVAIEAAECILHPESDDEESFVVLCRSLPPESLTQDCAAEVPEPIKTDALQESLALTTSALSQMSCSSSSIPPMPKVNEQNLIPNFQIPSTASSSVDLSPDEIQQKVDLLVEENLKLKDTLHQNNLAMKKQYETLVLWQEDVMKVHQSHKEKFADTKKFIENLKRENAKLIEALKIARCSQVALEEEMEQLKTEIAEEVTKEELTGVAAEATYKNSKQHSEDGGIYNLENAKHRIAELEHHILKLNEEKLEIQELMIQKRQLTAEIQSIKKELCEARDQLLKIHTEYSTFSLSSEAKESVLNKEVQTLKEKLEEQSAYSISIEAYEGIKEQLLGAQMHITKLQQLRNEDKEILNAREEQITKLENLIKEFSDSNDTITALRTQLELYKSDFEAERQAKESVRAEKEQIADDLRHLQRRNQQLLEEIERSHGGDFVHVTRSESRTSTASAPQDEATGKTFMCPKCGFTFSNYQALENHVYRCIDIDNLF